MTTAHVRRATSWRTAGPGAGFSEGGGDRTPWGPLKGVDRERCWQWRLVRFGKEGKGQLEYDC